MKIAVLNHEDNSCDIVIVDRYHLASKHHGSIEHFLVDECDYPRDVKWLAINGFNIVDHMQDITDNIESGFN